jgi:hypothetical protein
MAPDLELVQWVVEYTKDARSDRAAARMVDVSAMQLRKWRDAVADGTADQLGAMRAPMREKLLRKRAGVGGKRVVESGIHGDDLSSDFSQRLKEIDDLTVSAVQKIIQIEALSAAIRAEQARLEAQAAVVRAQALTRAEGSAETRARALEQAENVAGERLARLEKERADQLLDAGEEMLRDTDVRRRDEAARNQAAGNQKGA